MKALDSITKHHHQALMVMLMVAFSSRLIFAQDATRELILQNSANEQDVRRHTADLVQQVQALIDELSANSISGDDVKVLQTTKAVLNNLSSTEMERVIASLQKAGAASGTETGRRSAVDAYAGQAGIILEFHQILSDYEQQQAALELPERFKELTDRQTETMWTTVGVAVAAAGESTTEMTSTQQTTAQIVQSDQEALSSDVARAQQQLETAAQGSTGDPGNAMHQAEKDIKTGLLQKALDEAATDLKAGHLLQATSEQKIARDQLRLVTKDLNPSTDAVAALNETIAELAKLIQQQQDLLDQTNAVNPRPMGLDQKQGLIVDKTNSLREDMQTLSPTAAADVNDAINPMQLSRAALGPNGGFARAIPNQQAALARLEDAQKQVQQQLADAQKAAADAAKDSVAKMNDLKQQIQVAIQQQQAITDQTRQAGTSGLPQQPQGDLHQQTAALQQTAQPVCFPASQALGDAASQMNKAQQAMPAPAMATVQTAQKAAQAALAQALQDVDDDIAKAQAAAADPAALAAAAQSLDMAQSDVSQAIAASTPAGSPASSPPAASPAADNSMAASTNAPAATPADASTPAASSPSANSQASSSPQAGRAPGAATNGPSATPPAAGTLSMAAAAAALAQASAATAAAAATPSLPAGAAGAVKSAQASIAQGQQAAAKGNAPATSAAAAAAQASLAQAQAAVAMAQAGMSGAPMAGSGPPGPPGPPGAGSPGPGMPGKSPTPPGPDMASAEAAKIVSGGSSDKGTLHDVEGLGSFLSVASRDRTAIGQTQTEKRPQEYAPMIDQYMKNLADQSSSSSP